jgi:cbb3-type cytochrome oxidase subunit 3
MVRHAANWSIVALVALAIVVLPGGGPTLNIVMTLLSIAFFVAIALFAYRMYQENKFTVDSLSDRQRLVLYGAVGLAFVNFTATSRLFDAGGLGVLAWLMVLGLCSYAVMWVYMSYRSYD